MKGGVGRVDIVDFWRCGEVGISRLLGNHSSFSLRPRSTFSIETVECVQSQRTIVDPDLQLCLHYTPRYYWRRV